MPRCLYILYNLINWIHKFEHLITIPTLPIFRSPIDGQDKRICVQNVINVVMISRYVAKVNAL